MSKLLNVEEFADALGLKVATIRQKIWRRQIEFVRVGRAIRFKPETVQKIISEGTIPALQEESPVLAKSGGARRVRIGGAQVTSEPWDDVDLPPDVDDALPSDVIRLSQRKRAESSR